MIFIYIALLLAFFASTYLDAKSSVGFEGNKFWKSSKFWINQNGTLRIKNYWLTNIGIALIPTLIFFIVSDRYVKYAALSWLLFGTLWHLYAYRHNKMIAMPEHTIYRDCYIMLYGTEFGFTSRTYVNYHQYIWRGMNNKQDAINIAQEKIDEVLK